MRKLILFAFGFALFGCATIPTKLQRLQIGMSEVQVTNIMKMSPDSSSADANHKIFYYTDELTPAWSPTTYFVRFTDGKVESYGPVVRQKATPAVDCATIPVGSIEYTKCNEP